jgi:hypothetical protein
MPAPKKPVAPKATATKKATDTPKKTSAATKKTTPAKPTPTPTPVPTLDQITDKDVVRIWLKGRKGCWVGVITKVTAKELSFCVRWHKDSPPVEVKRADVVKLEVKQGAKYVEVAI